MSASPNYLATLVAGGAKLTTGDNSRTAPVTSSAIFAPASGGLCERITVIPVATTVASVIRIFRKDGSGNYYLYMEIPLAALTVSASSQLTPQAYQAATNPDLFPITVPSGWSLVATVNDTQTGGVMVQAEGGGA